MKFSRTFVRNLHSTRTNYKLDKINLSNGNSIVILPTIENGPEFRDQLLFLLNGLDKTSRYKLEFSMYLHTNDDNKNLSNLPIEDINSISNLPIENYLMTKVLFEKFFKFKGYFAFFAEKYLYNSEQDLIKFVSSVYTRLGELVINTNEVLDQDGFIEFKRPVIIYIKIDNN